MAGEDTRKWKRTKLTPQQREQIRERYADGETAWVLATEFGVTASTILYIVPARDPGTHQHPRPVA